MEYPREEGAGGGGGLEARITGRPPVGACTDLRRALPFITGDNTADRRARKRKRRDRKTPEAVRRNNKVIIVMQKT